MAQSGAYHIPKKKNKNTEEINCFHPVAILSFTLISLLTYKMATCNDELPPQKRAKVVRDVHIIDVRSDTVTKPTKGMRQFMTEASVGDDVYGEDPTVNKLQEEVANLLGKEAGLFVPSGTMGNLIAIMTHCNQRGSEILVGDQSHITIYEQGGVAQIAGVHPQQIKNLPDGTLDLVELEAKIRPVLDDHFPVTRLICIENTQNATGGRVIKPEYMDKLAALAKKHNIKLHLDGGRIINAATALDLPPSVLAKHADSVSMCLSKALGAPVGSVLTGSKEFIDQARRARKVLGGGMRQAGILAAAGLYGLEHVRPLIKEDHRRTKKIANSLAGMKDLGIQIDPDTVESNMFFFNISRQDFTAKDLGAKLLEPSDVMGRMISIKTLIKGERMMRIAVHHQITDDLDLIVERLKQILQ